LFHKYDGRPYFMWDDIEVSEREFRRHVDAGRLARVDAALQVMTSGGDGARGRRPSLGGGAERHHEK
jgi:hypothetical protein